MVSSDKFRKLARELKRKRKELALLYEFDKLKESASNTKFFLDSIVKTIMKVMRFEIGFLVLYDDKTEVLSMAVANDKGKLKKNNYELVKKIASNTIDNARIMVINNTTRHLTLKKAKVKNLIAAPIRHSNNTIGCVVFGNRRPGKITDRDLHILSLILTHIDSDIVHSKAYKVIDMKEKELSLIYRMDKLRDTIKDFDSLLDAVLDELVKNVDAKLGYMVLFDKEKKEIDFKVSSEMKSNKFVDSNIEEIRKISKDAMRKGELSSYNDINNEIDNIIAIPLALERKSMGVIGVINSSAEEGFSEEDKSMLNAIAKQVDAAIFEDFEKKKLKNVFQRYVSPEVMETILKDPDIDYLSTDRKEITVLFSDLRGFTSYSEANDPDDVVEVLNEHLEAMTSVILRYRGTIDKFVGDEIMALFGAPVYYEGHSLRAIKAALDMQKAHKRLISKLKSKGVKMPGIGIGINTGDMVVGNIGSKHRTDYTVIGDSVNTGARLCDIAKAGEVIIPQQVYAEVKSSIRARKLKPIPVKGKSKKLNIYRVEGLK